MRLRVRVDPGLTGTLLLQADVQGRDASTGLRTTAAGNTAVNVTP